MIGVKKMIDKMPVYEMTGDKRTVYKMTMDDITIDLMTRKNA
jgi:hypothetical protein